MVSHLTRAQLLLLLLLSWASLTQQLWPTKWFARILRWLQPHLLRGCCYLVRIGRCVTSMLEGEWHNRILDKWVQVRTINLCRRLQNLSRISSRLATGSQGKKITTLILRMIDPGWGWGPLILQEPVVLLSSNSCFMQIPICHQTMCGNRRYITQNSSHLSLVAGCGDPWLYPFQLRLIYWRCTSAALFHALVDTNETA